MTHTRRVSFACLTVGALCLLLIATVWAYDNTLTNPGFETGVQTPWVGANVSIDSAYKRSGTYGARVKYSTSIEQEITLSEGGIYSYGSYCKGDGGTSDLSSYIYEDSRIIANSIYDDDCVSTGWTLQSGSVALQAGETYKFYDYIQHGSRYMLLDDLYLTKSSDFMQDAPEYDNVLGYDGLFQGHADNWTFDGSSGYWAETGYGERGCAKLDTEDTMEIPVTIDYTGQYTLTAWHRAQAGTTQLEISLVNDEGDPAFTNICSQVTSWDSCSASGSLSFTGTYTVSLHTDNDDQNNYVDDVTLMGDSVPYPPWSGSAWIYRPLEYEDDLGYYQTYSGTTAYGNPYRYYNIWNTTPDAVAYSLTTLDINDVGYNNLGWYVIATVDAWTDVPSTTLVYQGLNSVYVAEGERIGASCAIGTVGNRWEFNEDTYHLLLAAYYPDRSTPFNPLPYMTRWPTEDLCSFTPPDGGSDAGAGATISAGGLWEPVCRECVRPPISEILSIGKWVDWLGCVITNLITCDLVRILNSIIGYMVGVFMLGVQAMGWLVGTIEAFIEWLGSLWNNVIRVGLVGIGLMLLNHFLGSDLVNWIWGGQKISSALWAFGKTFLLAMFLRMRLAMLQFNTIHGFISDFVEAVRGIFNVQAVDLLDIYGFGASGGGMETGIPALTGSGGVLSTLLDAPGANLGKASWLVFFGMYYIDYQINDQNAVFNVITWIVYALTAWSVIWWAIEQFEDMAEEST